MSARDALAEAPPWQPSKAPQAEFFNAAALADVPVPPRAYCTTLGWLRAV